MNVEGEPSQALCEVKTDHVLTLIPVSGDCYDGDKFDETMKGISPSIVDESKDVHIIQSTLAAVSRGESLISQEEKSVVSASLENNPVDSTSFQNSCPFDEIFEESGIEISDEVYAFSVVNLEATMIVDSCSSSLLTTEQCKSKCDESTSIALVDFIRNESFQNKMDSYSFDMVKESGKEISVESYLQLALDQDESTTIADKSNSNEILPIVSEVERNTSDPSDETVSEIISHVNGEEENNNGLVDYPNCQSEPTRKDEVSLENLVVETTLLRELSMNDVLLEGTSKEVSVESYLFHGASFHSQEANLAPKDPFDCPLTNENLPEEQRRENTSETEAMDRTDCGIENQSSPLPLALVDCRGIHFSDQPESNVITQSCDIENIPSQSPTKPNESFPNKTDPIEPIDSEKQIESFKNESMSFINPFEAVVTLIADNFDREKNENLMRQASELQITAVNSILMLDDVSSKHEMIDVESPIIETEELTVSEFASTGPSPTEMNKCFGRMSPPGLCNIFTQFHTNDINTRSSLLLDEPIGEQSYDGNTMDVAHDLKNCRLEPIGSGPLLCTSSIDKTQVAPWCREDPPLTKDLSPFDIESLEVDPSSDIECDANVLNQFTASVCESREMDCSLPITVDELQNLNAVNPLQIKDSMNEKKYQSLPPGKTLSKSRRRFLCVLLFLFLVTTTLAAGIYFIIKSNNSTAKSVSSATTQITPAPTSNKSAPPTALPKPVMSTFTVAPSSSPKSSPSLLPTSSESFADDDGRNDDNDDDANTDDNDSV